MLQTISHYVTVAYERVRLLDKLRESDRRKNEFLAMLSHELRNPLAPILNSLEILRLQRGESASRQQAHNIIERQVGHLVRLVDDLLEVSRISTGKINLQREPLDLRTVVEGAAAAAQLVIAQRRHELKVSLPASPLWIDGDSTRLEQVVVNLLNNASKYTEQAGHISLTLGQDGNDAVLSVKDSGMGIPPELIPRIFDMFTQADRPSARSQDGLGIGLALVQRLVEMHGGKVSVQSVVGKGSEFVVRVPVLGRAGAEGSDSAAVGLAGKSNDGAVPGAAPGAGSRRVLVVDDNVDTVNSLAVLLKNSGHDVRTAHDGPAALQAALDHRPDVAILDIGLPGHDGFELARRIRQQPDLKQTVLVAMTGYGTESDRQRSEKKAEFDFYLVKPTRFQKVLEILTSVRGK